VTQTADPPRPPAAWLALNPAVRDAAVIVAVTGSATAIAYASAVIGLAGAWLLAIAAAAGIGLLSPRAWLQALALASLPGAVVVGSALVAPAVRYMPIGIVIGAFAVAFARAWRDRAVRPLLPPLPVSLALGAYVGWATVSTIASIEPLTSVVYLAGLGGALGFAFIAVPAALEGPAGIRSYAATVAILGLLLAIVGFALIVFGPVSLQGRDLGTYLITEVTLFGQPTGIVVPRVIGIFLTPGHQALALPMALVALLAMVRPGLRPSRGLVIGALIVGVALVLTMTRGGWLAAAAGCLALAGWRWLAGRRDLIAAATGLLWLALLAALTVQAFSLIGRADIAAQRYGTATASTLPTTDDPETPTRGGASLSGRPEIWAASLGAIRARPLLGWGLGTNPDAIEPFLSEAALRFRGLTSHNTWLRTAVEMGLPGLFAFAAVVAAVLWSGVRQRLRNGGQRSRGQLEAVSVGGVLIGIIVAMLAAQGFETLLLGGLDFPSFTWLFALGLLAAVPRRDPI